MWDFEDGMYDIRLMFYCMYTLLLSYFEFSKRVTFELELFWARDQTDGFAESLSPFA